MRPDVFDSIFFCCELDETERTGRAEAYDHWKTLRRNEAGSAMGLALRTTSPSECGALVGEIANVVGRVAMKSTRNAFLAPISREPCVFSEQTVEEYVEAPDRTGASDEPILYRVARDCQSADFFLTDDSGGRVAILADTARPLGAVRSTVHRAGVRHPLPEATRDLLERRGISLRVPRTSYFFQRPNGGGPKHFRVGERYFPHHHIVSALGVVRKTPDDVLYLAPVDDGATKGCFEKKHPPCERP